MAAIVPVTVKVDGVPQLQAAIAEAVAAERRRFANLIRATCACQRCKDDVAALLEELTRAPRA